MTAPDLARGTRNVAINLNTGYVRIGVEAVTTPLGMRWSVRAYKATRSFREIALMTSRAASYAVAEQLDIALEALNEAATFVVCDREGEIPEGFE